MCNILTGVVQKRDFFEEGVCRQMNAYNMYNAKKQFDNSCRICVSTNKHMDCEYCPIREAYETNLKMARAQKPYIPRKKARTLVWRAP